MFYAYVLKSIHHNYYYKGHCQNLKKRLREHNAGMTKSIKAYIPFQIAYFETFENMNEAISREKYFKSVAGRKSIKTKISE